jgi:hypothetical protein
MPHGPTPPDRPQLSTHCPIQPHLNGHHEARIDWFAGDTIRGSFLASMFVADCYDRLHLHMAAKYFWMSVGFLAIDLENRELHDLAGTAILAAAQSDYMQGSWFGFS